MKKHILRYSIVPALALAVLIGAAEAPYAQEAVAGNETGVGARAMGMGEAQIGAVNDVTAVIHNPAALARLKNIEVQLGLDLWKRRIDTRLRSARGNGDASANTDFSGLGTLGVAYPVPTKQGSLVLAASYNRAKDFTGRFKAEGYSDILRGNFSGESIEEGGLGVFSFAGAVDISPNVSVGASLDFWSGNYRRDNRQLLNDPSESYSQLDMNGVDDDITAVSFKPAFLFFKDNVRAGGYVRLPMTFHISERNYDEGYVREDGAYFRLYELIDPSSAFNDVNFADRMKYRVKAPMQLGLGIALGGPGKTMLAFDVNYENWKQAKIEYPSDYTQEPNYFLDKYRPALAWKIGVEQPLPFINSAVRAGYMRHPLTFKGPRGYEDGAPPVVVTNERDFLTLGLGTRFDQSFGLDIGYARGFWSSDEEPRTDKENRNSVFLAVTYRFMK